MINLFVCMFCLEIFDKPSDLAEHCFFKHNLFIKKLVEVEKITTWKKMCKVCEGEILKGKLEEHADCKEYAKIVRYQKID